LYIEGLDVVCFGIDKCPIPEDAIEKVFRVITGPYQG
jgi:hypothetical protein